MSPDRPSTVQEWVMELKEEGNELHEELSETYQYYLDNVDTLENDNLSHTDLPHFSEINRSVIHAATMFGLSWGKDTDIHIVADQDRGFVEAFGIRENAERFAEQTDTHRVITVPIVGTDPRDDIQEMKAGKSVILPKIGECLEHLLDHEQELEHGDSGAIIDSMPHFPEDVKLLIAFSALFGKLWEYSDPALWIVRDGNDRVEGVYSHPKRAAEAAEQDPSLYTEPLTPRDNTRHANQTVPLN